MRFGRHGQRSGALSVIRAVVRAAVRAAAVRVGVGVGAGVALLAASPRAARAETPAAASSLSPTDARWNALLAGEIVKEPHRIDAGSRRFVGGVSYALVGVGLSDVSALVDDVKSYTSFLPLTKKARLVGENDGDRFVELTSGNSLVSLQYTLRFRRTAPGMLRFWLDPSRPHDVPDAWGYLRWQAVSTPGGPRLLMTYGVLAELPDDLTRDLFGDRVQGALLAVLPRVADALQDHRLARGASRR